MSWCAYEEFISDGYFTGASKELIIMARLANDSYIIFDADALDKMGIEIIKLIESINSI
jgi:hypothetical protein